jgi:flagellar assembly factor FliW
MSGASPLNESSPSTSLELEIPGGLTPFTWACRYRLMSKAEEWPFMWLRCLDDASLCLVAVPLSVLYPEAAERALSVGEAPPAGHPLVLGLVVLHPDPQQITVNLLAPLVVDMRAGTARQVVLDGPVERVRTPLAPALRALAA